VALYKDSTIPTALFSMALGQKGDVIHTKIRHVLNKCDVKDTSFNLTDG